MPHRIQLKRVKGWKKPAGAVVVSRPSFFGNPFTVKGYRDVWNSKATPEEARRGCCGIYRDWLAGRLGDMIVKRREVLARLPELRGKDLACWCPLPKGGGPDHCHAAVLIEYANRKPL